jgi:methylated-DNA-[protein]-cysteine S-methyltransferase
MGESGIATFITRVGTCALAWGPAGLVAVLLPDSGGGTPHSRLRRRFPDIEPETPPDWVGRAIESIVAHLAGGRIDLSDIALDFSGVAPFEASVYREARRILPGETLTYGELASRLGDRNLARAVGQALSRNPWPIVVPCHRVTAADGRTGGFSAPGGAATKLRLLELEGALAVESLPLFAAERSTG